MPKPKLDANAEIPKRLMKLIGCSLGMEALLEEIHEWLNSSPGGIENWNIQQMFRDKITAQLKRTGRLK